MTSYVYAGNEIDLLTVYQRHLPAAGDAGGVSTDPSGAAADKIAAYTYNGNHQKLTATDAAGQTTTYTYTPSKQLETVTNARSETTTYGYGDGTEPKPLGYVTSITSPPAGGVSAVTTFEYDGAKRLWKQTEPDLFYRTFLYDDLDRPLQIMFPDATYQEFIYTDAVRGMTLDQTGSRDRRGLWTYRHYDANRRMDSITDPENRTTLYGWCSCGSLDTITDPENHTTTFNRDIEGRVYQKVFADNTVINYLYDGQTAAEGAGASGRLQSTSDSLNRRTNYAYTLDSNVSQISYTGLNGAALNPVTPTVNYTYDASYNRLATMNDGSGDTGLTSYVYKPITATATPGAGKLQSIDGPLANDTITFVYDQLGRPLTQAINGVADSVTYDQLGRVETASNPLVPDPLQPFTYGYVGVTNRLQTVSYPNGQSANYSYYPNSGDNQLQTLRNLKAGNVNLSRFDYVYDKEHQITQWTKQFDGTAGQPLYFGYDGADQLTSIKNPSNAGRIAGGTVHGFGYDHAGNRQTDTNTSYPGAGYAPSVTQKAGTFNSLNQLSSEQQGPTPTPPPWSEEGDPLPPPPANTYSYDANGNTNGRVFTGGAANTFEWDAANRLTAITYSGTSNRTEFSYDGLSHWKKIVEKTGSTV
ncbi:MAG: hypothetical protein ACR2HH_04540, partial [Chthoniobacterales bacterium]